MDEQHRFVIDAEILAIAAAAPPIPEPQLSALVAIWQAAVRTTETEKVASCSNS